MENAILQQSSEIISKLQSCCSIIDQDAICLAYGQGLVLVVKPEEFQGDQVDIVGEFEKGLKSLQISPDGLTICVATNDLILTFLNQDWFPDGEVNMMQQLTKDVQQYFESDPQNLQIQLEWREDSKYVAVGMQLADRVITQIWERDSMTLFSTLQEMPGIQNIMSWQPNCRHLYAAKQSISSNSTSQQLDIVDQQKANMQGQKNISKGFQFTQVGGRLNENRQKVDGVIEPYEGGVMLFEANGLEHGGFPIQLRENYGITQLKWSIDSNFLAVVQSPKSKLNIYENEHNNSNDGTLLSIWQRNNWHWYLKQEIDCPSMLGLIFIMWDQRISTRLHIIGSNKYYQQIDFGAEVVVNNQGTVAVVDGNIIKVTLLRNEVVPPPLSSLELICDASVTALSVLDVQNDTIMQNCNRHECIAAVTSLNEVLVFKSKGNGFQDDLNCFNEDDNLHDDQSDILKVDPAFRIKSLDQNKEIQNLDCKWTKIQWANENILFLVGISNMQTLQNNQVSKGNKGKCNSELVIVDIQEGSNLKILDKISLGSPVVCMTQYDVRKNNRAGVLLSTSNGQVTNIQVPKNIRNSSQQQIVVQQFPRKFSKPCTRIQNLPLNQSDTFLKINQQVLDIIIIGLTQEGGQMEVLGGGLIANGVLSFTVRSNDQGQNFLIYTTVKNVMKILSLSDISKEIESFQSLNQPKQVTQQFAQSQQVVNVQAPNQPQMSDRDDIRYKQRQVEQGSYIISSPQNDIMVVVQLPRGNLEVIQPRYLVLNRILEYIDLELYMKAFKLAQRNRIDLNIICDYRWPQIIYKMDIFLQQVKKPYDLQEFLLYLKDGSVVGENGLYKGIGASTPNSNGETQQHGLQSPINGNLSNGSKQINLSEKLGMFLGGQESMQDLQKNQNQAYQNKSISLNDAYKIQDKELPNTQVQLNYDSNNAKSIENKVNLVCACLREAIERQGQASNKDFLKILVMSYVVQKPQDLDSVMTLIKNAKQEQSIGDDVYSQGVAEDALKQVLLYIESDALYKASLGLYELELAYMVIANSQNKDPGEYLSYLRRYAQIENQNLRKHEINDFLQRYPKALLNLLEDDQFFDQALRYAEKHELLQNLLTKVKQQAQRQQVTQRYAQFLERKQKFEDAALSYMAAGSHREAMQAYKKAQQWEMALMLAYKNKLDKFELQQMAAEIFEDLQTSGKHNDAAKIALNYLDDVEQAVGSYCEARQWRSALEVSQRHKRQDLIKATITPNAAECAQSTLEDIHSRQERLEKYFNRFKDILDKRQRMQSVLQQKNEDFGNINNLDQESMMQDDVSQVSTISNLSLYTQNDNPQSSGSSTQLAPSTVGGRPAQKKKGKQKDRRSKIHQGTPQEEQQIVQYIQSLGLTQEQLQEISQLTELLTFISQISDAQRIQNDTSIFAQQFEESITYIILNSETIKKNLQMQNKDVKANISNLYLTFNSFNLFSSVQWKWNLLKQQEI